MKTWAILATGPSMSQQTADAVRGKCGVIAVSNAYTLAPWADALVSHDMRWWHHHKEARGFAGRRFCRFNIGADVEVFSPPGMPTGYNSGLMAARIACRIFNAEKILLLGFDMHGTHFFGPHPEGLKNTSDNRRRTLIRQFSAWDGCEIVNCTAGSAIPYFKFMDLKDAL